MHAPAHRHNTGINPHAEAPKWMRKFTTAVRKGPVIKASSARKLEERVLRAAAAQRYREPSAR